MDALKSHRIDFVWIYMGVEGIQAQHDNLKLNVFNITDFGIPDYYTPNIITGPDQIKQKPDLLRRFMAATAQAQAKATKAAQPSRSRL